MDRFLTIISRHISSVTFGLLLIIYYLVGKDSYLEFILPTDGRLLALGTLASVVVLYEISCKARREIIEKIDLITQELKVNALVQAVNLIYERYEKSTSPFITNEYAILEIGALRDTQKALGVNSYIEGRLRYLSSKIRRRASE